MVNTSCLQIAITQIVNISRRWKPKVWASGNSILTLVLDEKINAADGHEISSSNAQNFWLFLLHEWTGLFRSQSSSFTVQVDAPAPLEIRGEHVLIIVPRVQCSLLLKSAEAMRLRGCEAARLRGYAAARLRGCEATRLTLAAKTFMRSS